ncbi:Signal transduction histidine-protein kinase ArlS [Lactococcus lactis]|nr:Signal transduction histidine-protein kinase ArlS [Lactococcus lactis]
MVATDGKDVKQVPVSKNPLEVHQLSQSFNRLLNRLNQKIENEQQFVSDASHELRTPVAAIRGHVNLLKKDGMNIRKLLMSHFLILMKNQ